MTAQLPIWDGLTRDEHEAQYNPQRSVPNFADAQARRAPLNAAAIQRLRRSVDVAYGARALHMVDIYPAEGQGPRPVHIFFHGGYWRAQDKLNFAFVATELVARGITAVIVNYDLCPAVTLDGTVTSALACVAWVGQTIGAHGGDPMRVTLSGHSAGAHLGAACLATDWTRQGLPADLIKGAVLISGIYDPAPAALTTVNSEIRLTQEIIERHNYECHPPVARCPVWIIAGGQEPWHWIDQSFRYAHHLHRHGRTPGVVVSPSHHHFDIMDQYAAPESDVMRCLLSLPR
jgi:arylformamidase